MTYVGISLVDLLNFINEQGYKGVVTIISDCNYSGQWAALANQNWSEGENFSSKFTHMIVQGSTSNEKMAEWNAYRLSQMEGDSE